MFQPATFINVYYAFIISTQTHLGLQTFLNYHFICKYLFIMKFITNYDFATTHRKEKDERYSDAAPIEF